MGDKERPCAQEPHGALLGIQKERNKRSCRNKKEAPKKAEKGTKQWKSRKRKKEQDRETGGSLRGWATASVTQGKAGTRPADSRDTHSGTSSRVSVPLLWMKMPLSLEKWSSDYSWSLHSNYVTKTCLHGYMDFIATSWKLNLVNSQIWWLQSNVDSRMLMWLRMQLPNWKRGQLERQWLGCWPQQSTYSSYFAFGF